MSDNVHINTQYDRGEGAGRHWRGETHLQGSAPRGVRIAPVSASGDVTGQPAYPLPGTDVFSAAGSYDEWPMRSASESWYPMSNPYDTLHPETLIYRSDTTPRRDGRIFRALPASVTTPQANARFLDGSQGDVYG